MNLCDKCFAVIEKGAPFCAECGAPAGGDPTEGGSDALVYPEIAKANLHRMRGEEAEAEKICLAILRRFPNNPTSHVLLGDIHFEQAQLDQAKQWYEMALELAPDNAVLKAKLDRVSSEIERESVACGVSSLEVKPPGRGMAALLASVLVLVLIVAGLSFWLGNASRRTRADAIEPISINGLAPVRRAEPPNEQAKKEAKEESQAPSTTPTTQPAPTPAPTMSAAESSLHAAAISQLGPLGSRLSQVTYEADQTGAVATLIGEAGADVGRDSVEAAQVGAAIVGQGLARVNVRVLDPTSRNIRFSASMTRESLAAATGQPGTAEWAASVLLNASPPLAGG
ncbi:MAG: tetratricopeptide repeat protein [Armatimonadetes bacterium]|nr:tetratricopeptide repeat protein [Armatimonadota bacterium]